MSKRNKLMLDLKVALTLTLKRGKHAGKALAHLVHHHHRHLGAALTCRSDDSVQVIRPQYYEFSCSNTPRGSMFNKLMGHHRGHYSLVGRTHEDEVEDYNTNNVLRRALEIMNEGGPVTSPLVAAPVRQLRVTDSPFLMDSPENSDDHEVDVEAEEFIKKFYRDLSEEKEFAATLDSPSPFQFVTWDK
ncbi:unnamed protein product [Cuscuta campestris]|nr:unnamed protein product [Cuscuta campestris]